MDQVGKEIWRKWRTRFLRLPLVYGPGWKGNLAKMADAVARGRFPPLPRLENRRSLVHVEDVVQALLLAATNPVADGKIYLVTDGRAYSTRQIYEWMCEAAGRRVPAWAVPLRLLRLAAKTGDLIERLTRRSAPINSQRLEKLLGSAWFSSARIERELGFRAQHNLRESIMEMTGHADRVRAV
jgi:UDP-glucose 4-epimerase